MRAEEAPEPIPMINVRTTYSLCTFLAGEGRHEQSYKPPKEDIHFSLYEAPKPQSQSMEASLR